MDSACLAYLIRPATALIIDYGQLPFEREKAISEYICELLNIKLLQARVSLPKISSRIIPEDNSTDWGPFRNQLLITIAGYSCIQEGLKNIVIGTVKTDRKFLDGTPEFIEQLNRLLGLQEGHISLSAPAQDMTTTDLYYASGIPESIFDGVFSCTEAAIPCGICPSCQKYDEVMRDIKYKSSI